VPAIILLLERRSGPFRLTFTSVYNLSTNMYYEKLEEISDLKVFLNASAGHSCPAGRYLPTPCVDSHSRADDGITVSNCRINRLLFEDVWCCLRLLNRISNMHFIILQLPATKRKSKWSLKRPVLSLFQNTSQCTLQVRGNTPWGRGWASRQLLPRNFWNHFQLLRTTMSYNRFPSENSIQQ